MGAEKTQTLTLKELNKKMNQQADIKLMGIIFLELSRHLDYIIRKTEERLPEEMFVPSSLEKGKKFCPLFDGFCSYAKNLRIFGNILNDSKYANAADVKEVVLWLQKICDRYKINPPLPERSGEQQSISV